jgi:hypothetical protein
MSDAVTSPPKRDSDDTSLDALAAAAEPAVLVTLTEADPLETADPSAGYETPGLKSTVSRGGEVTVGVAAPLCPGTITFTAYASDSPSAGGAGGAEAPAEATETTASARSAGETRASTMSIIGI